MRPSFSSVESVVSSRFGGGGGGGAVDVVHVKSVRSFVMELVITAVPLIALSFIAHRLIGELHLLDDGAGGGNGSNERRRRVADAKTFLLDHRGRHVPELNSYESALLADVIMPADIRITFDDIGGLADVLTEVRESILLPLSTALAMPETQNNALYAAPSGLLLYGPPGTGKTLIAKAIAGECDATFINVRPSMIQSKFFGESEKIVRALFTLAAKLAPSIIFIDEIDVLCRQRTGDEERAQLAVKGELMTCWDGITTSSANVVVIAATNRPFDVDEAVLRRLPRQLLLELPNATERRAILKVLLRALNVDEHIVAQVADRTDGYSGADLKEVCRFAAMEPIKHARRDASAVSADGIRPLNIGDFDRALTRVPPNGQSARQYRRTTQRRHAQHLTEVD